MRVKESQRAANSSEAETSRPENIFTMLILETLTFRVTVADGSVAGLAIRFA